MGWGEIYTNIIMAPPKRRTKHGPSHADSAPARVQQVEPAEAKSSRRDRLRQRIAGRRGFFSVAGALMLVTLLFGVLAGLLLNLQRPNATVLITLGCLYVGTCIGVIFITYHGRIAREREWATRFDTAESQAAERDAWYRAQAEAAAAAGVAWVRPERPAAPEPVRFVRDVELVADSNGESTAADAPERPTGETPARDSAEIPPA